MIVLLAIFSIVVLIVFICMLIAWISSREEDGAKRNLGLGLHYFGEPRKYRGYVKIGLFNYIGINKVSADSIIHLDRLTNCYRIFYTHKTIDSVWEDYWFLKLSFPAWLWDQWNYRVRRKRAKIKTNNEVMISFLQAIQKDIDAERQRYLDSIKEAKDIMSTISGGKDNVKNA